MLQGSLVTLRPPIDTDVPLLYRLRNDPDLAVSLLSLPRGTTAERVKQWMNGFGAESLLFVVAAVDAKEPYGYVQLTHMDAVHGTAELGICLDAPARGQGRGRQALELLEKHAQATFGVRKIVLYALADNSKARRLYGRIGYREVGVLRAHFYNRGAYHDVMIMEKLLG